MADIAMHLALVTGVLAAFFVGPGLAIVFLLLRKARRAQRAGSGRRYSLKAVMMG